VLVLVLMLVPPMVVVVVRHCDSQPGSQALLLWTPTIKKGQDVICRRHDWRTAG